MDDDELLRTATVVGRAATRLVRRLNGQRLEHGPAPMQLSVLSHLYRRGPLTPTDLATADRVQPQSLTRVLTVLEGEGLIHRQPDTTDGRRSLIEVTPAGQEALNEVLQQRASWLAQAMAAQLTPVECEVLRLAGELLDRLLESGDKNWEKVPVVSNPAMAIRGLGEVRHAADPQ